MRERCCFFLLGVGAAGVVAVGVFGPWARGSVPAGGFSAREVVEAEQAAFERGVNSALDATMLLDLEERLVGTRRKWGEHAKEICERLGVERAQ